MWQAGSRRRLSALMRNFLVSWQLLSCAPDVTFSFQNGVQEKRRSSTLWPFSFVFLFRLASSADHDWLGRNISMLKTLTKSVRAMHQWIEQCYRALPVHGALLISVTGWLLHKIYLSRLYGITHCDRHSVELILIPMLLEHHQTATTQYLPISPITWWHHQSASEFYFSPTTDAALHRCRVPWFESTVPFDLYCVRVLLDIPHMDRSSPNTGRMDFYSVPSTTQVVAGSPTSEEIHWRPDHHRFSLEYLPMVGFERYRSS